MLKKETLWFFVLPLVLIIAYYYVVSLDKVLLFITFFTPLAINFQDPRIGATLSIPTEPLMFGVVIVFLGNLLLQRNYNRHVARHPLSYLIYFSLLWMLITSFTSHLPLISFKHLLSRIWFVVPFYFVAVPMFRNKKNIHRFLWFYMVALSGVIVYTLIRHAAHGFDEEAGHWVMSPFYNDHTAYGAALALYLPVLAGYLFYPGLSFYKKLLTLPFLVLFIVAVSFFIHTGGLAGHWHSWCCFIAGIVAYSVSLGDGRSCCACGHGVCVLSTYYGSHGKKPAEFVH